MEQVDDVLVLLFAKSCFPADNLPLLAASVIGACDDVMRVRNELRGAVVLGVMEAMM